MLFYRIPLFLVTPIILFLLSYNSNFLFIVLLIWLFAVYFTFYENYYNILIYVYLQSFFFFLLAITVLKIILLNFYNNSENYIYLIFTNNQSFFENYIQLSFFVDFFSGNFVFLTCLLTTVILLYSYNYMKDDVYISTFVLLISLFAISMVTLLIAGNYFTLILGWELIGLTSFLLINFWYNRAGTFKSALKAFSFNKFSDSSLYFFFFFLLSNNIIYLNTNNFWILTVQNINFMYLSFLFLLFAGFCKSVQFGFHTWLPDSMEAPIPASSLIHSATLVSAGVYLCSRYSTELQFLYPNLSILSSITAFYGSIIASTQNDLKKILAYSTISHCGYLFFLIYSNNLNLQLIYLHLHGFFKAAAFMLVGFILQSSSIYQDYRYLSVVNFNSYEFYVLPLILLNLAGLPFVLGFYSKFFFLNVLEYYWVSVFNIMFIKLGAFTSIIYSLQITYNVYFEKKRSTCNKILSNKRIQKPNLILVVLTLLALLFFSLIIFFIFEITVKTQFIPQNNTIVLNFFYKLFILFYFIYFKNISWYNLYIYLAVLLYVVF